MADIRNVLWIALVAVWALAPLAARGADEETSAAEAVVEYHVPYIDDGEFRHTCDIYVPPGEGPFPAVLMIHGGAWTSGSKGHMVAHARAVVEAGYTVVSINYRLAPKHKFPAQIDDCRSALAWMQENAAKYKIDPERIATYGYSAGGHLASLLGMQCCGEAEGPHVKCVIAGGAPCEFRNVPPNVDFFSFWLGGSRREKPENYRLASPTSFVTKQSPPVFFFHGEADNLVQRNSPEALAKLLTKEGVKTEFYNIDGKGHIGAFLDTKAPMEAVKFLDAVLKGAVSH
jgi:triacylglycerol lipase